MCSNIGTPNNHHFPFGTNGKIAVLGVPILKHFRVVHLFEKNFYSNLKICKTSIHILNLEIVIMKSSDDGMMHLKPYWTGTLAIPKVSMVITDRQRKDYMYSANRI